MIKFLELLKFSSERVTGNSNDLQKHQSFSEDVVFWVLLWFVASSQSTSFRQGFTSVNKVRVYSYIFHLIMSSSLITNNEKRILCVFRQAIHKCFVLPLELFSRTWSLLISSFSITSALIAIIERKYLPRLLDSEMWALTLFASRATKGHISSVSQQDGVINTNCHCKGST